MTAGLRNQTEHNPAYSAAVIAAYGVVPKPRHSAEAPWNAHKGGFPKPKNWRERSTWYVRGGPATQSTEKAGLHTFARGFVQANRPRQATEPTPLEEAIEVPMVAAWPPRPVHEPEPAPVVPEPEPVAPAPVAHACTCEADAPLPAIVDAAAVAAYLRELAGKYGPRRAHKLEAMAAFVEGAR